MAILNNLYPPAMMDTLPAFVRTETCKIYFSLSSYNKIRNIKNVQISLINQKTNKSVFKTSLYPSGIKIANILQDQTIQNNYNYYVQIQPSDLVSNIFELNQFYKVQLRFTSIQAENPPSNGVGIDTWLANNINYFSEWSTVCLIKGIAQPHISLENFDQNNLVTLSNLLTKIVGKMYYSNSEKEEKEYLKYYRIQIYKTSVSNNNLVIDSENIYTDNYASNEINYEVNYDLDNDIQHVLVFSYTTNNLYTNTLNFNFKIKPTIDYILDAITNFEVDSDNGRIKINIEFNDSTLMSERDLMIKRSSSKTNFNQWETLKTIPHSLTPQLGFIWYDTSIESGIWYKYRIQQVGHNGRILDSKNPLICVFDDMFLTNGSRQLKIQFNPIVSNFKYNVVESQQVTLGSQFPFIKRNGNSLYRTFSIGGLITSLVDTGEWYNPNYYEGSFHSSNFSEPFTSKEKVYGKYKSLYDKYNEDNNISIYEDYIYEKEFRQQVENFLYQYDTKLFRSTTEGNILIKLMDINLQPVNELGRRLYSFSANAVEIDAANVENYVKYNIVNKTYHICNRNTFSATFDSFDSIFEAIYDRFPSTIDRSSIKFLKLDIAPQVDNAIFYIKKAGSSQPIRSVIRSGSLIELSDIQERYIEDCYFNGQHAITDAEDADEYYKDFPEQPAENTVYNILTDEDNIVDDYVDYSQYTRVLTVTDQGVILELNKNYSLLTKDDYNKYIFINGHWYLFDADHEDISFSIPATVIYYYEITKED